MVYFIELEETPFVRIGFTDDLSERVKNLQSQNPHDVRVLATCEGDRRVESYYHSIFKNSHVRGDWYRKSPQLEKFVAGLQKPRRNSD